MGNVKTGSNLSDAGHTMKNALIITVLWALLLPAAALATDGHSPAEAPRGPAELPVQAGPAGAPMPAPTGMAVPAAGPDDPRIGAGNPVEAQRGWQYRGDLPYGAGYEARLRGRGWGHGRGRGR
jgi:hypothetical protein